MRVRVSDASESLQATEVRLTPAAGGAAASHRVAAGEERLCLAAAGRYAVAEHPCLRFAGAPLAVTAGAAAVLELTPTHVAAVVRVAAAQASERASEGGRQGGRDGGRERERERERKREREGGRAGEMFRMSLAQAGAAMPRTPSRGSGL